VCSSVKLEGRDRFFSEVVKEIKKDAVQKELGWKHANEISQEEHFARESPRRWRKNGKKMNRKPTGDFRLADVGSERILMAPSICSSVPACCLERCWIE